MSLILTGLENLVKDLQRRERSIENAVARGVTKGALLVQKTAIKKINDGPKSGRVYERVTKGKGGRANSIAHQASAPGEAPAADTGDLARSVAVVKAAPARLATARVIVTMPYAAALEFGTKDGRIEERPFLRPSLEENREEISQMIRDEVKKAVG